MLHTLFPCLAALLLFLLVRIFLMEVVRVKGRSMLSTLQNGEWLLVSKLPRWRRDFRRGDVVICFYPNRYLDPWKLFRQYFVKRLIALPGETIAMEEGVVLINGEPLAEPYLDPAHTRFRRTMPPRTLGEDEYFVMGDNRDNSNDSRRIGPLPRRMLVGRVRRVIFPFRNARAISDR